MIIPAGYGPGEHRGDPKSDHLHIGGSGRADIDVSTWNITPDPRTKETYTSTPLRLIGYLIVDFYIDSRQARRNLMRNTGGKTMGEGENVELGSEHLLKVLLSAVERQKVGNIFPLLNLVSC